MSPDSGSLAPTPMVWSPKLTLSGTRDTGPYMHACMHTYIPYITLHCIALHDMTWHTYIHTCMHTYIHTYTQRHTYLSTYLPTYLHTYIPTYLRTHVHTYTRTHVHTYVHTYIHACMHACMDAWMHGCMDAWMHGCMHTCMHAWMHGCMHTYQHTYHHTNIPTYIPTYQHTNIPPPQATGGRTRRTIPPPQATRGEGPEEPYHHPRPQGGGLGVLSHIYIYDNMDIIRPVIPLINVNYQYLSMDIFSRELSNWWDAGNYGHFRYRMGPQFISVQLVCLQLCYTLWQTNV